MALQASPAAAIPHTGENRSGSSQLLLATNLETCLTEQHGTKAAVSAEDTLNQQVLLTATSNHQAPNANSSVKHSCKKFDHILKTTLTRVSWKQFSLMS